MAIGGLAGLTLAALSGAPQFQQGQLQSQQVAQQDIALRNARLAQMAQQALGNLATGFQPSQPAPSPMPGQASVPAQPAPSPGPAASATQGLPWYVGGQYKPELDPTTRQPDAPDAQTFPLDDDTSGSSSAPAAAANPGMGDASPPAGLSSSPVSGEAVGGGTSYNFDPMQSINHFIDIAKRVQAANPNLPPEAIGLATTELMKSLATTDRTALMQALGFGRLGVQTRGQDIASGDRAKAREAAGQRQAATAAAAGERQDKSLGAADTRQQRQIGAQGSRQDKGIMARADLQKAREDAQDARAMLSRADADWRATLASGDRAKAQRISGLRAEMYALIQPHMINSTPLTDDEKKKIADLSERIDKLTAGAQPAAPQQ